MKIWIGIFHLKKQHLATAFSIHGIIPMCQSTAIGGCLVTNHHLPKCKRCLKIAKSQGLLGLI